MTWVIFPMENPQRDWGINPGFREHDFAGGFLSKSRLQEHICWWIQRCDCHLLSEKGGNSTSQERKFAKMKSSLRFSRKLVYVYLEYVWTLDICNMYIYICIQIHMCDIHICVFIDMLIYTCNMFINIYIYIQICMVPQFMAASVRKSWFAMHCHHWFEGRPIHALEDYILSEGDVVENWQTWSAPLAVYFLHNWTWVCDNRS